MHKQVTRRSKTKLTISLGLVASLVGGCAASDEMSASSDPQAGGVETIPEEKSSALILPAGHSLWPGHTINVCFLSGTWNDTTLATWRNQVRIWVQNSISAAANLQFTGWGQCGSNTGGWITIEHRPSQGESTGCTSYPDDTPLCGYNGASVTHEIIFGTSGIDPTIAQGMVIHEFMHRIGFQHEFMRADNTTNDCDLSEGVTGNTFGTTYDSASVLNFSYCGGIPNTLSLLDRVGLRRAYGALQPPTGLSGRGSVNPDAFSDIILTGMAGAWTIPVARSLGNGNFAVWNETVSDFPSWASGSGAKAVGGDFDGDQMSDVAIVGMTGAWTIPVAFSNGEGHFFVTNSSVSNFPGWASTAGAKAVPGDYNADGRTDIALVGPSGWNTVPMAQSNGNGSFFVTNFPITNFATWAAQSGAKPVAGDFNGDHADDIALVGMAGSWTIPVAFSTWGGSFSVTNVSVADFPGWAQISGNKPVSGDFNGDGFSDIALVGAAGAFTIPVAYSNGSGGFTVANRSVANFPGWASQSGAKPVAGDLNGDGRGDIAITGMAGATTIPVAFAQANGDFLVTNMTVTDFPSWATNSGAQAVGGY
jgi:hypothetical protein